MGGVRPNFHTQTLTGRNIGPLIDARTLHSASEGEMVGGEPALSNTSRRSALKDRKLIAPSIKVREYTLINRPPQCTVLDNWEKNKNVPQKGLSYSEYGYSIP